MAQNNVTVGIDNQTVLNTITKDYLAERRVEFERPANDLIDILMEKAETIECNTLGDYETMIEDSYNFSATPGGENKILPDGKNKVDAAKIALSLTQTYANAEITRHSLIFRQQSDGSYVDVVHKALSDLIFGVEWYRSVMAFGNGTGQIATVGTTGSSVSVGSSATVSCNNTYIDLGIDNTQFMRVGINVEFYRSGSLVGTGLVTAVHPTYRRASDNSQTGTFTFVNNYTSSFTPTKNDQVFIAGAYGSTEIMQGLRTIINPAIYNTTTWGWVADGNDVFEGLYQGKKGSATTIARSNTTNPYAEIFRSKLWRTDDNGKLDLVSDATSHAAQTGNSLSDWDMGTLRDVIAEMDYNSKNSGQINGLLMDQFMAEKAFKIAEDKIGIYSGLPEAEAQSKVGKDLLRATGIRKTDGTVIPIITTKWMPSNEIIGVCFDDLFFLKHGNYEFLSRNGGVWEPSFVNGRDNFQAPYMGFENIGARRCDKCFSIQGLKDSRD